MSITTLESLAQGPPAEHLLGHLGAAEPTWEHEPQWLRTLRQRAADAFRRYGMPTNRLELWKHTNPAVVGRTAYVPAPTERPPHVQLADLGALALPSLENALRLVFVNGRFAQELSDSLDNLAGLEVQPLSSAFRAEQALPLAELATFDDDPAYSLTALNTALCTDGLYVRIKRNQDVRSTPLHLLHISVPSETPQAVYPRVLVVAEESSAATLIENHVVAGFDGAQPVLNCNVVEVDVHPNAQLRHLKLQHETPHEHHIARTEANVQRDATYRNHTISFGSPLTRNDHGARLAGENAHAQLHGLTVLDGKQHVDNHTRLDHAAPQCTADELYAHVLDGAASAVFYGRIIVRPGAQQTDAVQNNRTVLLSDKAKIDAMPQLEIYADDVKCTHGATSGPLDAEAMYYLRSRGLSESNARSLLTFAFAADIFGGIELEPVHALIERTMFDRLDMQRHREELP